jgi:hypothetical protein
MTNAKEDWPTRDVTSRRWYVDDERKGGLADEGHHKQTGVRG